MIFAALICVAVTALSVAVRTLQWPRDVVVRGVWSNGVFLRARVSCRPLARKDATVRFVWACHVIVVHLSSATELQRNAVIAILITAESDLLWRATLAHLDTNIVRVAVQRADVPGKLWLRWNEIAVRPLKNRERLIPNVRANRCRGKPVRRVSLELTPRTADRVALGGHPPLQHV